VTRWLATCAPGCVPAARNKLLAAVDQGLHTSAEACEPLIPGLAAQVADVDLLQDGRDPEAAEDLVPAEA